MSTNFYKLYLDDVRETPDGWLRAYTADQAIEILQKYGNQIQLISFDHDLGLTEDGEEITGYKVARYIEKCAWENTMEPIAWEIHSANPVGRQRITAAMERAELFWSQHGWWAL